MPRALAPRGFSRSATCPSCWTSSWRSKGPGTAGTRITDLKPIQGLCAEAGGAVAFFGATALGIPIYTIRTVTGSIVSMGAARRTSAVRWESGARHRGSLGDHRAVLGRRRHRLL